MGFHSSIHQWQEAHQMTSLLYAVDGRAYRVVDLLRLLIYGKLERRKVDAGGMYELAQYRVVESVCYHELVDYLEEYAALRDSIVRLGGCARDLDREHGSAEYMSLIQQADELTSEK